MNAAAAAGGWPPDPPPRDYTSTSTTRATTTATTTSQPIVVGDDRLRLRLEACRNGILELDALRSKHTLMMEQLRSRLPVIPGGEDVQARREKKTQREILDRSSIQSVDSGVSSLSQQTTLASTRSSSPTSLSVDDAICMYSTIDKLKSRRAENIYDSPPTTMPYSKFRKISLETHDKPPLVTSRSCHRGVWHVPQRPKSMYDTSTSGNNDFLPASFASSQEHLNDYCKPIPRRHQPAPEAPVIQFKEKPKSTAFVPPISSAGVRSRSEKLEQQSPKSHQRRLRTAQKPEVVFCQSKLEKVDVMFRANFVYVGSGGSSPGERRARLRFSPSRSPPTRKAPLTAGHPDEQPTYATPCKIRTSPRMNSRPVTHNPIHQHTFAAKPFFPLRPPRSRMAPSTWTQSPPL